MSIVFTSFKNPKLPISIKIPVTRDLLQIVYICMTAFSKFKSMNCLFANLLVAWLYMYIIWKKDPLEIEKTYNIRKQQTRFYWVYSWELMESATILTPPSTGLSSILLSVRTQYS